MFAEKVNSSKFMEIYLKVRLIYSTFFIVKYVTVRLNIWLSQLILHHEKCQIKLHCMYDE